LFNLLASSFFNHQFHFCNKLRLLEQIESQVSINATGQIYAICAFAHLLHFADPFTLKFSVNPHSILM